MPLGSGGQGHENQDDVEEGAHGKGRYTGRGKGFDKQRGDADLRDEMADLPQRRTIRWQGYDYAQRGAYYLTICTHDRLHLFGRIADGVMHPSPIGDLAQQCWDAIPQHMPHVDIEEFVVMPNHVHGIVIIREQLVGGASDVRGVGVRHDAPDTNVLGAPGIGAWDVPGNPNNADRTTADDPGPGIPGGGPDVNTRARNDAPLRDPRKPPGIPRGALGQIVASYKSAVTRMVYRDGLLPRGTPIWQRNYWDRVIRDDAEQERIAKYIQDNPKNWKGDRFNR